MPVLRLLFKKKLHFMHTMSRIILKLFHAPFMAFETPISLIRDSQTPLGVIVA